MIATNARNRQVVEAVIGFAIEGNGAEPGYDAALLALAMLQPQTAAGTKRSQRATVMQRLFVKPRLAAA